MKKKRITKKQLKKIERIETRKKLEQWAVNVKSRDGNKCVICGSEKMLNAHHIIPRENMKFMLDVNNGISLCPLHHNFSREISAHKNSIVFYIWMEENRKEQFEYLKEKWKE